MPEKDRHRSLGDTIEFVFNHEFGSYLEILAGHIPGEWHEDNLPLEAISVDVQDQLTLLLAGREYFKSRKKPVYGDMLKDIERVTRYRDEKREWFEKQLEEVVIRARESREG